MHLARGWLWFFWLLSWPLIGMAQQGAPQAAESGDDWAFALVALMGWSVPGYLVLQILLLRRLSGGWRRAAWVPMVWMVPAGCHALFALLAGSNLWPIFVLFLSPVALLFLLGLLLLKWLRA